MTQTLFALDGWCLYNENGFYANGNGNIDVVGGRVGVGWLSVRRKSGTYRVEVL